MQQYKGTFVLVSHDRYFISEVANKIWYIEDQLIKDYPGTYADYEIWRKKNQDNQESKQQTKKSSKPNKKKKDTDNTESTINTQISKLKTKLESIENEIETIELEISQLEEKMSDPEIYSNLEKLTEANKQYDRLKSKLDVKNTNWEQIVEQIENFE